VKRSDSHKKISADAMSAIQQKQTLPLSPDRGEDPNRSLHIASRAQSSFRGEPPTRYYVGIAIIAGLLVFAGFARSYYLRPLFGFSFLPLFLHLHGIVMTSWFVLFIVQSRLIAAHRIDLHRRLGIFGAVLAPLMFVMTCAVAIRAGRRGLNPFPEAMTAPAFLLLNLGVMATFLILVIAALWLRRRSEFHKRLMVMATISLMGAVFSRLPVEFVETGGLWTNIALEESFVLACVIVDIVRTRRLHPAFLWGGLFTMASYPGLVWVGNTSAWARLAAWILR
jgi:hypothetical protein